MRKYKVTATNRNMVNGLIKKFTESCNAKRHVYKFNRQIVFPYLTDEQVRNSTFAIPVARTCKFNGLRSGDTVTFYGGNRIIIKHSHAPEDQFVRIVPKNKEVVNRFLSMLARSIPVPEIKREFLFDKVIMNNSQKRYVSTVPLNFEKLGQELKEFESLMEKAEQSEDFDDQSVYPSRLIKFEILSILTVPELQNLLNEFMKLGLVSLPTPPHPPLSEQRIEKEISDLVCKNPGASFNYLTPQSRELTVQPFVDTDNTRTFTVVKNRNRVSTSCEAMYLDD